VIDMCFVRGACGRFRAALATACDGVVCPRSVRDQLATMQRRRAGEPASVRASDDIEDVDPSSVSRRVARRAGDAAPSERQQSLTNRERPQRAIRPARV
jgi:hypothetical protein